MSHNLVSLACHAYAVAALIYLFVLIRPGSRWVAMGRLWVAAGLVLHGGGLALLLGAQGGRPVGLAQGFSFLSFLLLSIFFVLDLRYRRPVLGAFLTPLALATLLPALLMPGEGAVLPAAVRQPLLPVHIGIALLGLAAFALASGVAGLYLLMERQVKAKHFGLLFARLPSLEFLDALNRRLVVWGFAALSITLVTGAFFSSARPGPQWAWEPKEIATLVAWGVFAGVLTARMVAGWQGRKVAFLTMAGFALLLVSFFSSYDLGALGGLP